MTVVRPEIQGLRALAVGAVVIYHLWPQWVPGGFVGVDIFFAISGFLITGHLVREVSRTGRVSVSQFWARRLRRLLPASLLVLLATAVTVWLAVPVYLWDQFFREIAAAALYVENWVLSADAVDYLASDNLASPVQHYWSLSAEEQFYLVWPLLVIVALGVAAKLKISRTRAILVILGVVTAASLAYSIILTATEPTSAYFITPTRAWEFGLGGILAVVSPHARLDAVKRRTAVAWTGWMLLAASLVLYSDSTPFPSATALLPVVGALAVMWAGSEGLRFSPTSIARLRPVQFIGDVSYSTYLWHWAIIVLLPHVTGRDLNDLSRLGILIASIALGWATKKFVEDPVRTGRIASARPRFTFIASTVALALVVSGAGLGLGSVTASVAADRSTVARIVEEKVPCFGAAAMDPALQPCAPSELDTTVVPSLASSTFDRSDTWDQCRSRRTEARECVLGVDGGTRVALIGDSHAHHWITAVEAIAEKENWEVHVYVRGACPFSQVAWDRADATKYADCVEWNDNVDSALAGQEPYEYVLTSLRAETNIKVKPGTDVTAGFAASWQPLIDRGATIVGIKDVPLAMNWAKRCIKESDDPNAECAADAETSLDYDDLLADAATQVEGAVEVDLTDFFCADDRCPAIIGGVLVYRDSHHITATYATTLAPYLLAAITDET